MVTGGPTDLPPPARRTPLAVWGILAALVSLAAAFGMGGCFNAP